MAKHNRPDERDRTSNFGLDLTKRKDRSFYTELTRDSKLRRLWEEHRKSSSDEKK